MTAPVQPFIPLCSVCGKPVPLETAKTDDQGKLVHEECYFSNTQSEDDTVV
jgi:hypothetical protein